MELFIVLNINLLFDKDLKYALCLFVFFGILLYNRPDLNVKNTNVANGNSNI